MNLKLQDAKFDYNILQVLEKIYVVSRHKGNQFDFNDYNSLGDTENIPMKNPEKEDEFLKRIQDLGAIKLIYPSNTTIEFSCLEIIHPRFNEVYKKFNKPSVFLEKKQKQQSNDNSAQPKQLINKDSQGDYFYNTDRISMMRKTLHYDIFDILYSIKDQNGFASYEDIEKELRKRGWDSIDQSESRNKRITNALYQQLFRFVKIGKGSLKNKTPDGRKLIDIQRGRGLQLNTYTV